MRPSGSTPSSRSRASATSKSSLSTGVTIGSSSSASHASNAVSRARAFGLVYTAWNVSSSAASARPATRDWSSPRAVSRRSASGRASCGSASPWRSSQSWLDMAGTLANAAPRVPARVVGLAERPGRGASPLLAGGVGPHQAPLAVGVAEVRLRREIAAAVGRHRLERLPGRPALVLLDDDLGLGVRRARQAPQRHGGLALGLLGHERQAEAVQRRLGPAGRGAQARLEAAVLLQRRAVLGLVVGQQVLGERLHARVVIGDALGVGAVLGLALEADAVERVGRRLDAELGQVDRQALLDDARLGGLVQGAD